MWIAWDKFLGVIIDEKLNWSKHIQHVTNKVRCSIAQLYEMRKLLPTKMKKSVYNAIVNSQLSYAISVWGCTLVADRLEPLFILQKRALRNLFSIRKVSRFVKGHTKPEFKKYNILTVYNIYNYMTLLDINKLVRLKQPEYLSSLLRLDTPTQRNNRLYTPAFKVKKYQNNFCYQGPNLWNLLSSSASYCNKLTLTVTSSSFKSKLKTFLLKMQSYGQSTGDYNWYVTNKSIPAYLTAIKSDPHFKL